MGNNDQCISILVVDDDERTRDVVSRVLMEEGYSVTTANDGQDAILKLRDGYYAVAVVDLIMPGMNGLDLLRTMRSDYPETEVIALSGASDKWTRDMIMRGGAFTYLTKPCKIDEITRTVQQAVHKALGDDLIVGIGQEAEGEPGGPLMRPGVLIVDSDVKLRRDICRTLDRGGYKAVGAASGEEALLKLTRGRFEVVLLDVSLPGMNGFELLREIESVAPDIVPVMLSKLDDRETMQAALAGRAFSYLVKPCGLHEITEAVEQAFAYREHPDAFTFTPEYSRGKSVLVVDDEDHVRQNVVRYLEQEGYDVAGVSDGKEALFVLSQEQFNVVVLDLKMPKVDGTQVLRSIRENSPDTFVIILSVLNPADESRKGTRDELVTEGAFACLQKPIKLAELVKVIDEAFRQEAEYWQGFRPTIGRQETSEEDAWKSLSEP